MQSWYVFDLLLSLGVSRGGGGGGGGGGQTSHQASPALWRTPCPTEQPHVAGSPAHRAVQRWTNPRRGLGIAIGIGIGIGWGLGLGTGPWWGLGPRTELGIRWFLRSIQAILTACRSGSKNTAEKAKHFFQLCPWNKCRAKTHICSSFCGCFGLFGQPACTLPFFCEGPNMHRNVPQSQRMQQKDQEMSRKGMTPKLAPN